MVLICMFFFCLTRSGLKLWFAVDLIVLDILEYLVYLLSYLVLFSLYVADDFN